MIGLGSTSELGIGIAIRLHDQFSAQARRVNQQLLEMRKNANSAVTGAMRDYRNNALMIAGAATGISIGMFRMVDAAAQYDHVINQIAIVGGKELGKTRYELSQFAQEMSKVFPNSPKQVAQAMFENVKAGVSKGLEQITRYQLAVSTATNEAIEGEGGVAEGLLGIMNAMDLTTDSFPRVANAVSQAANISMASVYDINEAMQYFSNTAHIANINLEDTLALVAKLSQSNIRGSSAGTALSNMIRHVAGAAGPFMTPKQQKAWQMLGVSSQTVAGLLNSGKIFDLVSLIDKATRGMNYTTKSGILGQLFNIRGQRGLVNLFGSADPTKTLSSLAAGIRAGVRDDIAMKQAKAMANDPWADIRKIGNAIARFGIQFLNSARPTLRVLMGITTKVINVLNTILSTPLGKVFAGVVAVGIPLIGILFAFRAAALTATIALRGFAASSAVGGFGGLFRSGLGLMGMSRLGPMAGKVMMRNGIARVAAGETVNLAGKLYKGGQILPKAWAGMAGISGAAVAGGVASKLTGFLGKAAPWIGRIAGFGLRWLPVIGWIWTGVEVLKLIFGETKKANERPVLDPVFRDYYKNLDEQLFGMAQANSFYQKNQMSYGDYLNQKQGQPLQQTINLNVDGNQAASLQLQQNLENTLNNQIDFEVPE
jgi:TP901 family phage tail tape measure protein